MKTILVLAVLVALGNPFAAVAQRADSAPATSSTVRPAPTGSGASAARPAKLACAPLIGQVFDPNGQPLIGATLMVKGTHDVYVTDAEGKFLLTAPVYEGQVLAVQAAGFVLREVSLDDCLLPRLVLERKPDARIKRTGKRAGQVTRLNNRSTNLK